mmetsp:Transcript_12752/g.30139  ORF Transcript_12752/g.30139 Transcript_12752/m.30139 type:complete len:708 (+) Transcript_12752:110-2233(+)
MQTWRACCLGARHGLGGGAAVARASPRGASPSPLLPLLRLKASRPALAYERLRGLTTRGAAARSEAVQKTALLREIRKKRTPLEQAVDHVAELRRIGKLGAAKEYTSVIKACDKGDKWQLALSLLNEMYEEGLEPAAETVAVVSGACERAGQPMDMPKAPVEPATSPGKIQYSRGALLQRLRRRRAEPSELAGTVATLVEEGHLDKTEVYTLALRMCESGEQWEWAIRLLDMCREGPGLEVETCNVGIAACAKAQQWQRALTVLDNMQRWAVPPDVASYHAAASACSRSGEWQAAIAVLDRAQLAGLADSETYSIGMMACASAEAWSTAVGMLSAIEGSAIPGVSKDILSYGIAVYGCERGGAWPWCLSLLAEMQRGQVQPDAVTYACASQACSKGGNAQAARSVLAEMRSRGLGDNAAKVLEEASWVTDGPEMQQPVPLSALATMAPKEVNVYKYVAKRATPGDIDSVLEAIESFAQTRLWLKIQGEEKRELLERSLRKGDRIVECGCYVGYSSLVMARQLRRLGGEGSVTTIEVDAATAYVARAMISFAGAEGEVQVRVGCASDWIATGQLGTIDFLLLDHRGTIYHEDLHAAEPILSPHARVFADNVLYPGAPLFLNYIDVQGYDIEIHELKEFQRPDLDDWVVIARPQRPHGPMPRATPPELRRLSAEVDAISWRSQQGPVDWVAFQDRLKPVFYNWKEERGL